MFFFVYSIPRKAYGLKHVDGKNRTCVIMSPYLIKALRKFYVFNNITYQKYEPTQISIYSLFCYQFDIYFYVGLIDEKSLEDMEENNFDLLQLIIPEMRILLAFSYFPTYSEIWLPPNLPLHFILHCSEQCTVHCTNYISYTDESTKYNQATKTNLYEVIESLSVKLMYS